MKTVYLKVVTLLAVFTIGLVSISASGQDDGKTTYGKGFRKEEGGWIYLHIEGSAKKRGEQMGYLMAKDIEEYLTVFKVKLANETTQTWDDYRKAAEDYIVPKIEKEYLDENKGLIDADKAKEFLADQTDPLTGVSSPGPNNIMARYEVCKPKAVPLGAGNNFRTSEEYDLVGQVQPSRRLDIHLG